MPGSIIIDAHEATTDAELDALVAQSRNVTLENLGPEDADKIADLCVRIMHADARRASLPMSGPNARPYRERTANERAALRGTITVVVKAMVLLGWFGR